MWKEFKCANLLAGVGFAALSIALAGNASAQSAAATVQQQVFDFKLSSQPLDQALRAVARASRAQIIFDREAAAKIISKPLVGRFTAEQALNRLILGTPLTMVRNSSGVFAIKVARRPAATASYPLATPASAAEAQDAAVGAKVPEDRAVTAEQAIVVTGTRASLQSAERLKRDATVIVDGVSADDIGALPDASMTEAVIRVPGISANENGALSARGMNPDFIQQMFNGRILPSPDGGTRRVQTGSFPTEGLTGVYLQKTSEASMIEGGTGGTILLQTIHPLETRRSGLEIVARLYSNSNSAKLSDVPDFVNVAPRLSATYIKRFTDTFGIAVTYAMVRQYTSMVQADGSAWRFGTVPRVDLNGDGRSDAMPQTLGVQINAVNDFRNSVISMVQWDPVPGVRMSLDGFFNQDEAQNHNRRYFAYQIFQGTNGATNSATVNAYDTVTKLDAPAAGYRGIVNFADGKDTTFGGGLNLAVGDGPLSATFDGSYFKATRRQTNPNFTFENDAANVAGQRIPFSYDVSDPFHVVTNFQPLTADDFALANGSVARAYVNDTIIATRADVRYKPAGDTFLKSIAAGFRVDKRHKLSRPFAINYTFGINGAGVSNLALRPDLDSSYLVVANPLASHDIGVISGENLGTWPWYDISKLASLTASPNTTSVVAASQVNGYIDNTEITKGVYGQVNFGTGALVGNVGVRYVYTDSTILGLQGSVGNSSLATVKAGYSFWLPELNTKIDLTRTLLARFALSKTMTRPNFNDTKIAASFDPVAAQQNGFATISAGNPNLRPYTSKGIDVALEWYPSKGSSITVSAYVKWVSGFLRSVTQNGTVLVNGTLLPATISTKINDPEIVRFGGFEVAFRKDLSFLPGFLGGLGIYANWNHGYTDAKANVASLVLQPTVDITADQFVKDIYNAQLYYTRGNVDIRLAYRKYSVNSQTGVAPAFYREIPSGTLDLSGSYAISRKLRLLFSMTNIVNDGTYQFTPDYRYPEDSYRANDSLLLNTTNYGRVIQAGLRYRF